MRAAFSPQCSGPRRRGSTSFVRSLFSGGRGRGQVKTDRRALLLPVAAAAHHPRLHRAAATMLRHARGHSTFWLRLQRCRLRLRLRHSASSSEASSVRGGGEQRRACRARARARACPSAVAHLYRVGPANYGGLQSRSNEAESAVCSTPRTSHEINRHGLCEVNTASCCVVFTLFAPLKSQD